MTTNPYEASLVPEPLVAPAFPTRGSPTEVEFDLTVEDYVVFNQEHTDRMFAMRAIRLVLTLLAGLSVPMGVAIYLLTTPAEPGVIVFLILWAVVNLLAFTGIAIWRNRRSPSSGSGSSAGTSLAGIPRASSAVIVLSWHQARSMSSLPSRKRGTPCRSSPGSSSRPTTPSFTFRPFRPSSSRGGRSCPRKRSTRSCARWRSIPA